VTDKEFMRRCIELASLGAGTTSPNPMVGCVIVRDGEIVGEGYHRKFGAAHAEIVALMKARNRAKNATMYVNIEPCAHFGKTPPCVDAIIRSGISRVVIATKDPNPVVNGRGIRILKNAGINVNVGILREEAQKLNEKFFKFMKTGFPFVALKLAQTLDGKIADLKGNSKWISSHDSRKIVHKLRSEYDAVMIGRNTALKDNPELTVRFIKGRNPVRIIIDGQFSLPSSLKIFNTDSAPTWILTSKSSMNKNESKLRRLTECGVRVFGITTNSEFISPETILRTLAGEGISSILIEGGAKVAKSFLDYSLVDKLYLFTSPKILGEGLNAITLSKPRLLKNAITFRIIDLHRLSEDVYLEANILRRNS